MQSRPIDKNNSKNIYCGHCEYFKSCGNIDRCENLRSPQFHLKKYYYNRCKCFEWKRDAVYVADSAE